MSQDEQGSSSGVKVLDVVAGGLGPGAHDEPGQLVPVSEAIKYRKRAQAAEQQLEQLAEQLRQRAQEYQAAQQRLDELTRENSVTQKLVQAGVTDMEPALLLAKERLRGREADADGVTAVIEELRTSRPYLFSPGRPGAGVGSPTAGVRSSAGGGRAQLHRLADQAARTGRRRDMQDYLRLRRSMQR